MPSSTSSSSTPPGRCGASPSGVPGWVCPAQPGHRPWPLCGRPAGFGHPAAAGRPPLHPEARSLEDHPLLPAEPAVGGRTSGGRARRHLSGAGGAGAHRGRPGYRGHCRQQPGCQRRGPVLHGRLRHPERSCHPHRPGRGCQPEGYGQAVCLAVHRLGMGVMALSGVGLWIFAPA